jgi:hypothetical protein
MQPRVFIRLLGNKLFASSFSSCSSDNVGINFLFSSSNYKSIHPEATQRFLSVFL